MESNRYDTSALPETQFEPGSRGRVLKNKLGIKLKREIDEAESVALKSAIDKVLRMYDERHRFISTDIRTMHKTWLGGLYAWVGEYRQVNISKGDFPFASSKQIPLLMGKFEKAILKKHTPCNFKSLERITRALAEVHVELVLIHPFREGNGRVARILSTLMASQARLPILDFSDITGKKRREYFWAVNSGMDKDYKPMEEIFRRIIERSLKTKPVEKS